MRSERERERDDPQTKEREDENEDAINACDFHSYPYPYPLSVIRYPYPFAVRILPAGQLFRSRLSRSSQLSFSLRRTGSALQRFAAVLPPPPWPACLLLLHSCNRNPGSMRSLHLCLDIVMLALLLRLALATIRNSREIIITDAVGAPCPSSCPVLPASCSWKPIPPQLGETQAPPECLISPNVTTHAAFGLQMSSDKCANYVCAASVCVCECWVCVCAGCVPVCQVKILPQK